MPVVAQRDAVDGLPSVVERAVVARVARGRGDVALGIEHDAVVVRLDADIAVVVIQRQGLVVVIRPAQRGRDLLDVARQPAVAVALFHIGDQPGGELRADRPAHVHVRAPGAEAAAERTDLRAKLRERRLGDDVDGATRLAGAVQRRARALEHFDPVHVVHGAVVAVLGGAVEVAVAQEAHAQAADGVVVGKAVAPGQQRLHPGGVLQRVVHVHRALLAQHAVGNDGDGGRDVAQGGVRLGAGRHRVAQAAGRHLAGRGGDLGQGLFRLRRLGGLRPHCERQAGDQRGSQCRNGVGAWDEAGTGST